MPSQGCEICYNDSPVKAEATATGDAMILGDA